MASSADRERDAGPPQRPKARVLLAILGTCLLVTAAALLWAWREGLLSGRHAPPPPTPSREAALEHLRQGYPADWVLKVRSHSDDFTRVLIWAGPPASEFVEEVELEWRNGAYWPGRARALTPELFEATGADPVAAVKASPTYVVTPQTTYRVVEQANGRATVVVENPQADPRRIEVYLEKHGSEWRVVGDDLRHMPGGQR
ncbi:MAG: hypothetical protein ACE5R4_05975 [Armatimonadota bacterium]